MDDKLIGFLIQEINKGISSLKKDQQQLKGELEKLENRPQAIERQEFLRDLDKVELELKEKEDEIKTVNMATEAKAKIENDLKRPEEEYKKLLKQREQCKSSIHELEGKREIVDGKLVITREQQEYERDLEKIELSIAKFEKLIEQNRTEQKKQAQTIEVLLTKYNIREKYRTEIDNSKEESKQSQGEEARQDSSKESKQSQNEEPKQNPSKEPKQSPSQESRQNPSKGPKQSPSQNPEQNPEKDLNTHQIKDMYIIVGQNGTYSYIGRENDNRYPKEGAKTPLNFNSKDEIKRFISEKCEDPSLSQSLLETLSEKSKLPGEDKFVTREILSAMEQGRISPEEAYEQINIYKDLLNPEKQTSTETSKFNILYDLRGLGKSGLSKQEKKEIKKNAKIAKDLGIAKVEGRLTKIGWWIQDKAKKYGLDTKWKALTQRTSKLLQKGIEQDAENDHQSPLDAEYTPVEAKNQDTDRFGYRTKKTEEEMKSEQVNTGTDRMTDQEEVGR